MKWLLGLAFLFGIAQADQLPKMETLRPTASETKTVAGLFRSPFYHEAPDAWIPVFRAAYLIDSAQTFTILSNPGRWREKNPLYRRLSNAEGVGALLLCNWLEERAVTGIKDRTTRNVVGWIVTLVEVYTVVDNSVYGVPLFSARF
jgi:hypothetical protein